MLFCHPDCIVEYVKSEVSHTEVNFKRNFAQEDLGLWQSVSTATETTFWAKKRTLRERKCRCYMQGCKQVNLRYPTTCMKWLRSFNFVYERKPIATCNNMENTKICTFKPSIHNLLYYTNTEFIPAVLFSLQNLCSVAPVSFYQLDRDTQCRPCGKASLHCQAVQAGGPSVFHRRFTSSTWGVTKQKEHATLCQKWVS